jgi:hypothetical protein
MDDRDPKVWKLARILIGKHGREAPRAAHERAQDSLDHQDYDGAALWSVTAKITHRMSTEGARRRPETPEPSLGDLLNDPVTQTVMAGDGVERAELEHVIGEAKQKLQD